MCAERAGLKVGDKILEFAGAPVPVDRDASKQIAKQTGSRFSAQDIKRDDQAGPWRTRAIARHAQQKSRTAARKDREKVADTAPIEVKERTPNGVLSSYPRLAVASAGARSIAA